MLPQTGTIHADARLTRRMYALEGEKADQSFK
jgi:hypothetical protein